MINQSTALNYLAAGLSVLPARKKEKCPAFKWKEYQERLPTACEITAWFANNHDAVCIVCGKVSGNLEVIDFDNHGELFPKWKDAIPTNLFRKLVVEQTPSGGYHVAYKCENEVSTNLKLVQGKRDDKLVTLIETRGTGGLVLCSPTDGYELVQGAYEALPCLTKEEQEKLLYAAWNLRLEEKNLPEPGREVMPGIAMYQPDCTAFEARPGDDFNLRGDIRPLLVARGWKYLGKTPDGNEHWCRPGKAEDATSATFKDGVFYVFSSNATPFEANRGYTPFSVYGLLEHDGNFKEAAASLLEQGFGKPTIRPDVDLRAFLESVQSGDGMIPATAFLTPVVETTEPPKVFWTAKELIDTFKKMKEPLIEGLLRREEVMNIVAAPKTGKSWLVLQLAIALATGCQWLGRDCTKSKVLLIDNELHPETESSRLNHVANTMGFTRDDLGGLEFFLQRGGAKSLYELPEQLKAKAEQSGHYDVIIIDALYKALPRDVDENSNGQITGIYNQIERIAREQKAAIILVHHTSKGNQANKSVTDVGSGAGAQSRAPDTHLALRPHMVPGVISVSCCVRSFKPVEPFCIIRDENYLWVAASGYEPNDLEGKEVAPGQGGGGQPTIEDISETIGNYIGELNLPMGKTSLVEVLKDRINVSKSRIVSALEDLCTNGMLEIRRGDYTKGQQASKLFYHGPCSPYYQPPEDPPPMVMEPEPAPMVTEQEPIPMVADAEAESASRTKSSSRESAALKPKTRKGTSKKKLRKTPSKDAIPSDSSE